MSLNSTRNIEAALRAALVDSRGAGFAVLETIQPVYQIEDLAKIISPSPAPGFITTWGVGAPGAGNYAGMEIVAPATSPIVVKWQRNDDAVNAFFFGISDVPILTTVSSSPAPGIPMADPQSTINLGHRNVIFVTGVVLGVGEQFDQKDIVVQPGQRFYQITGAANVAISGSVAVDEFLV